MFSMEEKRICVICDSWNALLLKTAFYSVICDLCCYKVSDEHDESVNEAAESFISCCSSFLEYMDIEDIKERKPFFEQINNVCSCLKKAALKFKSYTYAEDFYYEKLKSKWLDAQKNAYVFDKEKLLDLKGLLLDALPQLCGRKDLLGFRSELLSKIRFCMTDSEYRDYVTGAVEIMLNADAESALNAAVDDMKLMFYPLASADYKMAEPELAQRLDSYCGMELADKSEDEFYDLLEEISGELYNVISIVSDFETIIRDLSVLGLIAASIENIDSLFDYNIKTKDYFYKSCEKFEKNDEEMFEMVSDYFEELYDEYDEAVEKYNKKFFEIYNNRDIDSFSEELQSKIGFSLNVWKITQGLIDSVSFLSREKADKAFIRKKAEELCSFIDKTCSKLEERESKLVKRRFIGALFCPFSTDEYIGYVKESLINFETSYENFSAVYILYEFAESLKAHYSDIKQADFQ